MHVIAQHQQERHIAYEPPAADNRVAETSRRILDDELDLIRQVGVAGFARGGEVLLDRPSVLRRDDQAHLLCARSRRLGTDEMHDRPDTPVGSGKR